MSSPVAVDIFVEDRAHEEFVVPLLRRLAAEEEVPITHRVRSARGGHSRALSELELYQKVMAKGVAGMTSPEVLIVGIDGDCSSVAKARKGIQDATGPPFSARLVVASPDPHVERWYLADPDSFKAVVGRAPRVGKKKCGRDYYKNILARTVRQAGHPATLGGIEFARELVDAMDLYRAGRNDRSLKAFVDDPDKQAASVPATDWAWGGMTRAVWQLSGGPASRSYADVLVKHGVGLIGPGDAGPWTPARDDAEFDGGFVRRFASEVAVGDVFLLRTGIATIAAVGLVASDYQYVNAFDDVNGWDLQHARRVRWCRLPEEHAFGSAVFGANPPRCSRVWTEEVLDFAERFLNSPPTHWQTAALPELPAEEPPLDVVPDAAQGIVAQAADLVPLLEDRQAFGAHPSEDELIAHFVVPFLRALGWPPEAIAVQVIEAKRLGAGVEGALEQAKGYVEALGAPRDVIVTDGIRYWMYAGQTGFEPVACANLAQLKRPAAGLFARMQRP